MVLAALAHPHTLISTPSSPMLLYPYKQTTDKSVVIGEQNPDAISYMFAAVELHGKIYLGTSGIQATTEFSVDPAAQQTMISLLHGCC